MIPEDIEKGEPHLENTDKIQKIHGVKRLLTVKEVCVYLGIGQTKARELLRGNNGFGVQIGSRWYADRKKLDAWIEKLVM